MEKLNEKQAKLVIVKVLLPISMSLGTIFKPCKGKANSQHSGNILCINCAFLGEGAKSLLVLLS